MIVLIHIGEFKVATPHFIINPDRWIAERTSERAFISARTASKRQHWTREFPWIKKNARLMCGHCLLGLHRGCESCRCMCDGQFQKQA